MKLPSYEEIDTKVGNGGKLTAIEKLIYEIEPLASNHVNEFRGQVMDALQEVVAQNSTSTNTTKATIALDVERWICENPTRWTAVKELSPALTALLEKIAHQ